MNIRSAILLFVFISAYFTSCLSLKEVNEYAATSITSLNRINSINYSYADYCRRDCELRQMRLGEIDTLYNCLCSPVAAKADSTIFIIHKTITSYLQAIEHLSNNQHFQYDASGMAGALQDNPLLKLNEQQKGIITKAGNILATAATAYYRKNELKKHLEKADPVFSDLMETFIFLLDKRLRVQLVLEHEIRFTNQQQLLQNAKADKGLKQLIVKQSIEDQAFYLKHIDYLNCYVALLGKIREGHHQLYLQRNHLKDKNIKELAIRYASDVQGIAATVKQ